MWARLPSTAYHKEMIRNQLGKTVGRIRLKAGTGRAYGSQQTTPTDPRHSEWYREMIPGMIPIALLGSSVYLGLQLARAKLSHEKQVVEAQERVSQLEAHLKQLESQLADVPIERVVPGEGSAKKYWWW